MLSRDAGGKHAPDCHGVKREQLGGACSKQVLLKVNTTGRGREGGKQGGGVAVSKEPRSGFGRTHRRRLSNSGVVRSNNLRTDSGNPGKGQSGTQRRELAVLPRTGPHVEICEQ